MTNPLDNLDSAVPDPSAAQVVQPVAGDGSKTGRKAVAEGLRLALASGATVAQAAEKAGCSPRTVYRRLDAPGFRQAVANLRSEMVSQAAGQLASRMAEAAEALQKLLTAESETVRLGAARSILELGTRLREQFDHEQRLCAIEECLSKDKPQ